MGGENQRYRIKIKLWEGKMVKEQIAMETMITDLTGKYERLELLRHTK
jgi:hypothetical protein